MADITLPSGLVVKNVPEGIGQAELKERLISAGVAQESDFITKTVPVPAGQQWQQSIEQDPVAKALFSVPGLRTAMELGNAAGRSTADIVDFFGPDVVNNILQLAGSDARVPTLKGSLLKAGALAPAGAYLEPGLQQEIAQAAGETVPAVVSGQALLRAALANTRGALPTIQNTGRRVLEALGKTTPAQEATATIGAVVGGELGEETGIPGAGFVGSVLGGGIAIPMIQRADKVFTNLADFRAMASSLTRLQTDIAGEMLARSLRSSGMSVDDAMKQYRAFGKNALPADIDDSFRQILRAAMNIDEGISGEARRTVQARQVQSGQRISDALDIVSADDLDSYMSNLEATLRPQIEAMYLRASQTPLALSGRLRTLLSGESSLGKAFQEAQTRVADKRALGDPISHFTLIDETKHVLDDQIGIALRAGERNRARDLIRFKNQMMAEADAQIPDYAAARSLYAGKVAIENAADLGGAIFKTPRQELVALSSTMTGPEKVAYVLAAKDAIIKEIDRTGMNRNQVLALFGRNGDAGKLSTLFDTPQQANLFLQTLRREAEYSVTRNAVIGNSTTPAQLARMQNTLNPPGGYRKIIGQTAALLSGNQTGLSAELASIADGIRQSDNNVLFKNALIRAGDILLTSGMNPAKLERILRSGNTQLLATELARIAPPSFSVQSAAALGVGSQQITNQSEQEEEAELSAPPPPPSEPRIPPQARALPPVPSTRGLGAAFQQPGSASAPAPAAPPAPEPVAQGLAAPSSRQMLQDLFPFDSTLRVG